MKDIQREDIHIIGRHSNLGEGGVARMLKEHVYNGKGAWHKFIKLFLAALGIGFSVSGVVFFFAYNWSQLHRFVKIGLAECVLIGVTGFVLFAKMNIHVRRILLTGASILVGVLFAVFGQVYQTGANAYDFFLAWTAFVTLWVFIAGFAPLWLLYLGLINTTFLLYAQQVANDWPEVFVFSLLFFFNTAVLIVVHLVPGAKRPVWFRNMVGLASAVFATTGVVVGIFDRYHSVFPVLILITVLVFSSGIWYGLKTKNGFYLSVIPFSVIVIVSAFLGSISDGATMLLTISLFIIGSVTFTIKNLIDLQKKWADE
jgi:uncharacterized membrane protein